MNIMSSVKAPSEEYMTESMVGTIKGVMWLSALIPCLFVALRCYVRLRLKRVFGLDDAIGIVAVLILMAYCFVTIAASDKGLGRHVEFVLQNPQNLIDVALLCQVAQTLAIMSCTLAKTTFAITLLRIVVQTWAQYILWFVIITMNLFNLLAAVFVFAQCKDPRHLWNPAIPSECWPTYVFTNFSIFVGGYSGAQDFVLALLPWVIIMNLQMKIKEKIAIGFAMSLGIFAGTAAIVKTVYLVNLSKKTDFTWELPSLFCWAATEIGLTIVASSIPTLRPLLIKWTPNSTIPSNEYPLKSGSNSNNMFYPQSKCADINTQVSTYPPQAESDIEHSDKESIAEVPQTNQDSYRRHSHRITMTTEVTTTYS